MRSILRIPALFAILVYALVAGAETPTVHPLEPPDRSSPRATLTTFTDSIDRAWELYEVSDPGFQDIFNEARGCLDLSEIPPLVFPEVSAETALLIKDVLDRIELPPHAQIPDAAEVAESGISSWTFPHTEIMLVLQTEGAHQGQWLFSADTVLRADSFFQKVRHLPYLPGRKGGHVEELRSGSTAVVLLKLVEIMPSWFRAEVGGMWFWQWFGLGFLVVVIALGVALLNWIGRRWRESRKFGSPIGAFLLPLALVLVPIWGDVVLKRIFNLPGAPALILSLVFTVIGYLGLAWLASVAITSIGDLVVRIWFRDARPLKKQLVRVIFRIATIVVVTVIALRALQLLGVPVAGLIAGLGVGGLAIALAAQSTLENFIGGIILYADQPVRVGDICEFGSNRGTIEDVGLRSVKIRTIDQTLLTVPNGDFVKLQLENLSERDRVLLRENIHLRYETTREQLNAVLAGLRTLLEDHPQIDDKQMRVRFVGIGRYSLEVEIFGNALTGAWPDFLAIREDILIRAMKIIEDAGTRLALPTEIHYAAEQAPDSGQMA